MGGGGVKSDDLGRRDRKCKAGVVGTMLFAIPDQRSKFVCRHFRGTYSRWLGWVAR